MPSEGAAAMSPCLQSIPDSAAAIVHQLMPKAISSQVPDGAATILSRHTEAVRVGVTSCGP
jgi:hypothetical protein